MGNIIFFFSKIGNDLFMNFARGFILFSNWLHRFITDSFMALLFIDLLFIMQILLSRSGSFTRTGFFIFWKLKSFNLVTYNNGWFFPKRSKYSFCFHMLVFKSWFQNTLFRNWKNTTLAFLFSRYARMGCSKSDWICVRFSSWKIISWR